MLVCMAEGFMVCYVLRFETRRVKQYRCGSDMVLFSYICNQVVQSHNDKHRRKWIVLLLWLRQI